MKRKGIGTKLRFEVFERDRFTCQYCGRTPIENDVVLEVDHIVSVKNGGDNTLENLTTSCWACNSGKGAKTTIKKAQTPVEIEEQLARTKERLEQVVAMNHAMKQIVRMKKQIDQEKYEWVKDVLGEGFNEMVYSGVQKLFESKTFSHLSHQQKSNALEIIVQKHENQPLKTVEDFLKYLRGILKNMDLSSEEQEVLKQYIFLFRDHNATVYKATREMIIESAYWGIDYHKGFVKRIEKNLELNLGKTLKAQERAKLLTGVDEYKLYKNGSNFNYFVCDLIALQLNRDEV